MQYSCKSANRERCSSNNNERNPSMHSWRCSSSALVWLGINAVWIFYKCWKLGFLISQGYCRGYVRSGRRWRDGYFGDSFRWRESLLDLNHLEAFVNAFTDRTLSNGIMNWRNYTKEIMVETYVLKHTCLIRQLVINKNSCSLIWLLDQIPVLHTIKSSTLII